MLSPGLGGGVGVDNGAGQAGNCGGEVLLGRDRHLVGLRQGEVGRQDQIAVGMELMADPPQSHPTNFDHAWYLG